MEIYKPWFSIGFLVMVCTLAVGQDMNAFVAEGDAKYFDFWEGIWIGIKYDMTLDSTLRFEIKRSIHPAAFEEVWHMGGGTSIALRAWDKTNGKWGFTWISSNGLYQVWNSEKIDGNWYILKDFNVNGDKYLSRQGFILQADGTVVRTSEKTYDRKKWEVRFIQHLKKIQ